MLFGVFVTTEITQHTTKSLVYFKEIDDDCDCSFLCPPKIKYINKIGKEEDINGNNVNNEGKS